MTEEERMLLVRRVKVARRLFMMLRDVGLTRQWRGSLKVCVDFVKRVFPHG